MLQTSRHLCEFFTKSVRIHYKICINSLQLGEFRALPLKLCIERLLHGKWNVPGDVPSSNEFKCAVRKNFQLNT